MTPRCKSNTHPHHTHICWLQPASINPNQPLTLHCTVNGYDSIDACHQHHGQMNNNNSQSTTPPGIEITARRPQFDFTGVEKVWLADPIRSHFMNALSVLIPHSERIVMQIMRNEFSGIQDPILKQQVQALIKQEGAHAGMHWQSNVRLKQAFPAIYYFENIQVAFMKLVLACASPAFILALPAAFEHFTAAISRDYLTHHQLWTNGKGNQAVEFADWHALEEIEHQAVCFDVYKTQYKSGWRLVWILLFFWMPLTLISTFSIQLYLLHVDRVIYRPKNWQPYFRFVGSTLKVFCKGIFSYGKKQFRPWRASDQKLYQASLTRLVQAEPVRQAK